jgi:hypothetical protein
MLWQKCGGVRPGAVGRGEPRHDWRLREFGGGVFATHYDRQKWAFLSNVVAKTSK